MNQKPEIDYPCTWGYRVIGTSADEIRRAVLLAVQGAEYTLENSNTSAQGRYVSMRLTVTVRDEEHRLSVDRLLNGDPAVRMVL